MTKTKRKTPNKQLQQPRDWFSSLKQWKQLSWCVGFLFAACWILFWAIIKDDAAFSSGTDTAAYHSYLHVGNTLQEEEGQDVLWMPYFFSGMPTFGNVAYIPRTVAWVEKILMHWVLGVLFGGGKWAWIMACVFFGGVTMFLLIRRFRFSSLISLLAAITFMLSPFAIGLPGEGHGSKLAALCYLPAIFLITTMVLDGAKQKWHYVAYTGGLGMLVGSVMLTTHVQIAYYTLVLVGSYVLYRFIVGIKEQKGAIVAARATLVMFALVLGMLISSYIYLSVYEYSQFSIRGGGTAGSSGGLTWQYATNWSWHPLELVTLLIPGFFGFQLPYYWGPIEPWTNSTVYIGVIPILLTTVSLIYTRNRYTWFFILFTLVVILISFGRNFPFVYELLFTTFPFFNKFRAPVMVLHLIAFTIPILAASGLSYLVEVRDRGGTFDTRSFKKSLTASLAVIAALLILVILFKPGVGDLLAGSLFLKEGEVEQYRLQYGQQAQRAIAHLMETRYEIFWADTVKLLIITLVSLGAILAYFNRKIRTTPFLALLVVVLLVDLLVVDSKLVTPHAQADIGKNFQLDSTKVFLKKKPDPFRVFPMGRLFGDYTFAFHRIHSIGGYSAAKLKIYQTMIDSCLYRSSDPSFPLNMNIVNMLNVRFFVVQGQLPEGRFPLVYEDLTQGIFTYENLQALPRTFFVTNAVIRRSDTEVFAMLNSPSFDPSISAVIQDPLPSEIFPPEPAAEARIVDYRSRKITIETSVERPALLVLSEVFYPAGWKAFVDGSEIPILRTNSILRSVVVPGGNHTLVFSFDPWTYSTGWYIYLVAGIVAVFMGLLYPLIRLSPKIIILGKSILTQRRQ